MFSGSYGPADVTFLLKVVDLPETPLAEKERLIQSGRRHYSEMITRERLPSEAYLRVFHEGCRREKARLARDLITLAGLIADRRAAPAPITLVSLARAGTPVGVLLGRTLRGHFGRRVAHYSISIIRDRGIDGVALRHVLERHPAESVVFVDGWTGKGVIARELDRAVRDFSATTGVAPGPGLFAVADLSGAAAAAATEEDYLIPSSVLGATISGLISRSILNDEVVSAGEFHGCLYYRELEGADLSQWFVDAVSEEIARQWPLRGADPPAGVSRQRREELRRQSADFLGAVANRYGMRDVNHIKPGIGEATRALLRRVPGRLLLRDPGAAEVAHLTLLAAEKGVPVTVEPALPYRAAALIGEVDG